MFNNIIAKNNPATSPEKHFQIVVFDLFFLTFWQIIALGPLELVIFHPYRLSAWPINHASRITGGFARDYFFY